MKRKKFRGKRGKVAKIAIQACINSYEGEHGRVQKVFTKVIPFRKINVQGHFGFVNNDLYIVFEGSDSKADWRDNFKSQPKSMIEHKIKVHTGFLEQWRSIQQMIFQELHEHHKSLPPDKIIVTGHSLGGALATLCALSIARSSIKTKVYCLTFGSPRVGNRHFAKLFNKCVPNSVRYVYGADMVASVPLILQGYWHVDRLVRLAVPWYDILLFPIVTTIGNPLDHYPQLYRKAIF
jgi:predicted lipase